VRRRSGRSARQILLIGVKTSIRLRRRPHPSSPQCVLPAEHETVRVCGLPGVARRRQDRTETFTPLIPHARDGIVTLVLAPPARSVFVPNGMPDSSCKTPTMKPFTWRALAMTRMVMSALMTARESGDIRSPR